MRPLFAIVVGVLAIPLLLIVAIALGPVAVVAVAVAGFGLVVFLLWSIPVGLSMLGRSAERHLRHEHDARH